MLIISVQRVKHWACGSGSRSWVVLGAIGEVCEVHGHQAAYVTGCSVGQHLLGVVGSGFGAPSVPSNYGPPAGSVDCVNYLFYGFSDGRLLFFKVVAFMGRDVRRRVEEQVENFQERKSAKPVVPSSVAFQFVMSCMVTSHWSTTAQRVGACPQHPWQWMFCLSHML